MQAIVQNGYGATDVLRMAEIDRPAIARDEVLVRVSAAGVDRGVWHLMAGKPYAARLALGNPKNRVAGMDLAGTVAAAGDQVTGFAVGDEVFGVGRGSFAEYAAAKADKLAPKPAGLSFAAAAVVAVSGVTALRAVRDSGRVQAGQRVLVIGASGGVGSFAVQLAKAFGATVTGVCGPAKLDLVRSIGADEVLDYTTAEFADGRYDVILDIGGLNRFSRLRRALTPRGTLVIVGGEGGGRFLGMGRTFHAVALSPFVRQRLTALIAVPGHADLETLRGYLETGQVVPAVGATFPLAQVPEAVRQLESGQARGKIAITV